MLDKEHKLPLMMDASPAETQIDAVKTLGEMARAERRQLRLTAADAAHELHASAVELPAAARQQLADLLLANANKALTAITLVQKTHTNMSAWSMRMESERDELTKHVSWRSRLSSNSLL